MKIKAWNKKLLQYDSFKKLCDNDTKHWIQANVKVKGRFENDTHVFTEDS